KTSKPQSVQAWSRSGPTAGGPSCPSRSELVRVVSSMSLLEGHFCQRAPAFSIVRHATPPRRRPTRGLVPTADLGRTTLRWDKTSHQADEPGSETAA
ncbi:hypothetical protein ACHAWF_018561, partial [Thalassiosira exigua]